jgi:dCTP deaminase
MPDNLYQRNGTWWARTARTYADHVGTNGGTVMTVLSAKSIAEHQPPLVFPLYPEQRQERGLSYGLGPHGYDIRIAQDVRLWWGVTKLASSVERFNLPNNVRGLTLNKSTWRRRGLEVGAATILEAGWRGHLTLELTLLRPFTLFIPAGTPIAQIEFAWLDMPTDRPYAGKYQDQEAAPVAARMSPGPQMKGENDGS